MDLELIEGVGRIILSLTRDELLLIAGAVNEAIEAVDDWEFATRLGVDKEAARTMRAELRRVVSDLPPDGH
ncbi:hypothetical protein DQ237_05315 [Blastococcus sp. TF02-8]|uniref:hypothetical protein n=1 Tax=Blastococcus sp. TF02-8 TaxID=2250574 RepID=UPI000DE866B7|nr:hypothetical protein [Blastococcus sp. TF02-8]RBY97018.1 hypothetical protein DQ237_05315 [Blastococcus sp. TF02-8]